MALVDFEKADGGSVKAAAAIYFTQATALLGVRRNPEMIFSVENSSGKGVKALELILDRGFGTHLSWKRLLVRTIPTCTP